jgi:hypothetical protein
VSASSAKSGGDINVRISAMSIRFTLILRTSSVV